MNLCLVPYRFHETNRSLKNKVRLRFVLEGEDRELLNRVYESLQLSLGEDADVYCVSNMNQPKEIISVIMIAKK